VSESEVRPGGGSLGPVADPPNRATWSDPSTWLQGRSGRVRPTWGRILVLIALVVLAAIVARSCQQSQIRISKEQAIAIADRQIDFKPGSTQIRLLRQGLNRKPFWFVSLSDPIGSATDPRGFTRLVIVEIDANTGSVEDVNNSSASPPSPAKRKSQDSKTTPTDSQP
jgi:Peptidase propeptide and YPEB domain